MLNCVKTHVESPTCFTDSRWSKYGNETLCNAKKVESTDCFFFNLSTLTRQPVAPGHKGFLPQHFLGLLKINTGTCSNYCFLSLIVPSFYR